MDKSILETARSGDQLETLYKLRDKLAQTLDETHSARDIAPLAKRFSDTLADIARLEDERGKNSGSVLDEILERR